MKQQSKAIFLLPIFLIASAFAQQKCADYAESLASQMLLQAAIGDPNEILNKFMYPNLLCHEAEGFVELDRKAVKREFLHTIPVWEKVYKASLKVLKELSSSGESEVDGIDKCLVNESLKKELGGNEIWNSIKQDARLKGISQKATYVFLDKQTCKKYSKSLPE